VAGTRQRRAPLIDSIVGRPRAPESPDTCHLDAKTLHRQVRTHVIGFVSASVHRLTLRAMAANSAAVSEDRRGPITGCHPALTTRASSAFFFELPPWMTTLAWMAAPTAEDPAWRGFAGKTFRTVDRLLRRREGGVGSETTRRGRGGAPNGHGAPRAVDPSAAR